MHARLKPMGHRFSYRVMSLLIDLDRLDAADRQSPLFGVNRAALYSFSEADHGDRDGSSLRTYVQRCAAERGIDLTGGRVLLLCYPRLLGYTFNPLSVYFCYRADGELALMIYEVRNTFGDIHPYVLPVQPDRDQRCRRATAAGKAVLRLALHRDGDALPFPGVAAGANASNCGSWRPTAMVPCSPQLSMAAAARSTRPELLRAFFALPLVTLKIMAAIHWEALRLWAQGRALVPRQNAARNPRLATAKSNDYTSPALSARGKD